MVRRQESCIKRRPIPARLLSDACTPFDNPIASPSGHGLECPSGVPFVFNRAVCDCRQRMRSALHAGILGFIRCPECRPRADASCVTPSGKTARGASLHNRVGPGVVRNFARAEDPRGGHLAGCRPSLWAGFRGVGCCESRGRSMGSSPQQQCTGPLAVPAAECATQGDRRQSRRHAAISLSIRRGWSRGRHLPGRHR